METNEIVCLPKREGFRVYSEGQETRSRNLLVVLTNELAHLLFQLKIGAFVGLQGFKQKVSDYLF